MGRWRVVRKSENLAGSRSGSAPMPARLALTVVRLVGPTSAGAPLALVHRLHPGDRDRVAFLDQVAAHLLLGQPIEPRIPRSDQPRLVAHSEVPGLDAVELLAAHRDRHRGPRPAP